MKLGINNIDYLIIEIETVAYTKEPVEDIAKGIQVSHEIVKMSTLTNSKQIGSKHDALHTVIISCLHLVVV